MEMEKKNSYRIHSQYFVDYKKKVRLSDVLVSLDWIYIVGRKDSYRYSQIDSWIDPEQNMEQLLANVVQIQEINVNYVQLEQQTIIRISTSYIYII